VVAGSGPWLERLQQAAAHYSNVMVVGPKDSAALKELYRQARCFVSLSRHEAFGLVMAEAMACYTPVIATVTDGATEQINTGINGIVVSQQGDEAQVVSRFSQALNAFFALTPEQYQQMQLQGRASAEQYLLGNVVSELQQLYQRVVL
jgi:L-malate glycosyltransferase